MCAAPMRRSSGRGHRPVCAEERGAGVELVVRRCRVDDLPALQAILEESPEAAEWHPDSLSETLQQYPKYFLIGRQDEETVGFIVGRQMVDEGEILNLAVRRGFRRQGVGKKLVQELLEVFLREKVVQVFLEVRASNQAAISLYQGLGFRQVGERRGYYRSPEEAALLLAKRVI